MPSHRTVKPLKFRLHKSLVSKIYQVLEKTHFNLHKRQIFQPLSSTSITTDRCQTTSDLNVSESLTASIVERVEKEKNEEDNFEDLIIIWLDEKKHEVEENSSKRETRLREIVNCLKTFDDCSQCLDFIQTIKEEKIFLIICGSLGKTFINEIHDFPQISSVYIYCFNDNQHRQWTQNYLKIVGIFTNEHELVIQITKDVSSFYHNYFPVNIIHSININQTLTQNLTKDPAKFMWSQFLMDLLFQFPQTTHSKDNFIQECRRQYKNNTYLQGKISEFAASYTSSDAISWYTRDSFLYRIVNKALRTQNMLYILKCRFFIIDLYQNLKFLHSEFVQSSSERILTVYRGQMIAADEFAEIQMNMNGFIAINTFFSATYSPQVALDYSGNGLGRPMLESIFFEIKIDLSLHKTPFVDVRHISQFESEQELIFCLGTIFRIESIEPLTNTLWHVELTSINETSTGQLNQLARFIKKDFNIKPSYLSFGEILQEIGEYDQAERFYQSLLNELPPNHRDIPAVYAGLGSTIVKTQKNSHVAFYYLEQSLKLQMKLTPENLLFTETLESIAGIFVHHRQYQLGLDYYILILTIYNCVRPKTHSRLLLRQARVYSNIGYIYSQLQKLSFALKCYKISHIIERKFLPFSHPSIAIGLNNIATIYLKKHNFRLAEKYFQQANEIRQTSLPLEHHPDFAQMYNNLGTAQYERKNFDQALTFFNRALEIQLRCLPPLHPQTVILYNALGNTYLGKNNYYKALEMYEKALTIGEQCWSSNHPELSQAHGNIGNACRFLKDYPRALNSSEKALEIAIKCLPSTHSDLANAYRNLADVYSDTGDHSMALASFLKALDIYSKNPPVDPFQLGILYEELGWEYNKIDQYQEALSNLQKALTIFQSCHEDESSLTTFFFVLGRTYYQNNDYDNALLYIEKCLCHELASTSETNNRSLSQTYDALGNVYRQRQDYPNALKNYEQALTTILKDDSTSSTDDDRSTLIQQYQNSIELIKTLLN